MKAALLIALCAAALSACVPAAVPPQPAPARPPVPRPQPRPAPALPPLADPMPGDTWMDAPATPGDWTQGLIAGTPFALFGANPRIPMFAMRCVRASGTITIARRSAAPMPQSLTIRTETLSRSLVAEPAQGFPGDFVGVSLRSDDALLDAMALSKGRFAVEAEGLPPLYLPSWAEVSRVIEDCR